MNAVMVAVLFSSLLICILIGIPIAYTLMICSISVMLLFDLVSLSTLPAALFNCLNSFSLTAIAFFIFAGNLMDRGQLMQSIIHIIRKPLSKIKGGLGIAMTGTCGVFAAMTGTSVASAAAMGNLGIPLMEHEGYPRDFSAAVIAAGGTIGILIPPSLSFILIGNIINENIGKLFISGIVPGLLQMALLSACIFLISRKRGYGKTNLKYKINKHDYIKAIWAIFMPIIVLSGIYLGIFTPTEAAGVSVLYSLIVILFVFKATDLKGVFSIALNSAKLTANILFILTGASLFGLVLTYSGLPQQLLSMISDGNVPVWLFYVMMTFVMFVLGCVVDGTTQTVIAVPLLWPIAQYYGINPFAFAVYIVATVELATLTPPVGMNLFVVTGISGEPIGKIAKQLIPFFVVQFVLIFMLALFPGISTCLL